MYRKLFSIFFAFTACLSFQSHAQVITTIAGSEVGYSGDGELAAYCRMTPPTAVVVDRIGNVYICDSKNNRIRKIDIFGVITTVVGTGVQGMSGDGGPANKAKVFFPTGMVLDRIGNLYIADTRNHRIRKVDTNGIITTIIGSGVGGFGGDDSAAISARLNNPYDVTVDNNDNFYIADTYNNRIRKVNASGIITTVAGTGIASYNGDGVQATAANLNQPQSVAADDSGNVYIADTKANRIRKVNTSGVISTIAGNGYPGFGGDQGVSFVSQISSPTDLALDHSGNLLVVDNLNNRLRRINPSGVISTISGNGLLGIKGDGGPSGNAELFLPQSVGLDTADNIYIGEGTGRVRFIYVGAIKEESEITPFPNPCDGRTTIFLPAQYEELVKINIVDMSGRRMSQSVGPTNRFINLVFDRAGTFIIYAVSQHNVWKGKVEYSH